MKSFSISVRLWLMVGVATLALLVVGIVGLASAVSLDKAIVTSNQQTIPAINTIDGAQSALLQIQVGLFTHLINILDAKKDAIEKDINTQQARLEKLLATQEQRATNDAERKLISNDRAAVKAFLEVVPSILALSRKNMEDAARHVVENEMLPASNRALQALQAHADFNAQASQQAATAAASTASNGRALSWTVILLGIAAIGIVGFLLVRKIAQSLDSLKSTVEQINQHMDFTLRVPVRSQDEIGVIARTLNTLFDTLQASLVTLGSGIQRAADAASAVARSASSSAEAAESQSDAASTMAAAMEQMTVSIGMVNDRANEAQTLSQNSVDLAKKGGAVIQGTLNDIQDIATSVDSASQGIHKLGSEVEGISTVVSVIREVADQTNLLALNAAIEAARAGEQGRGFAVVADEVRKLAERTATSTREISAMVERVRSGTHTAMEGMQLAVQRVNDGVARAHDAGDAITQIGEANLKAVDMVIEITHAIREQGSASTSIAQRVEQIAQMAEEGSQAALASAEVANELDELSTHMRETVTAYRLA
ncbi:methyl-accepting chemotaxis protein [Uliginosibacterium gangwonense]|uniref:methyl-accepting chemotaxis protein n=1 Tax=Uliginosibacterium gangwonense TaxID=392736 RepID=UPI0003676DC0|nr:methyl-accepting chemotaxis protein [Uliginosibacterium gangwonense]